MIILQLHTVMCKSRLLHGFTDLMLRSLFIQVVLWHYTVGSGNYIGGAPYAEILPEDLYSQLHSGMRMPKPQHCAQEV